MNNCYTYFRIVGDFDPDEISSMLDLTPCSSFKKGTGKPLHKFSEWRFGRCGEYGVNVADMVKKTVAPLKNKTGILKTIKEKFGANLYIEVVPQLYAGEVAPVLGPDLEIIDFCASARAEIDIDLYICNG